MIYTYMYIYIHTYIYIYIHVLSIYQSGTVGQRWIKICVLHDFFINQSHVTCFIYV